MTAIVDYLSVQEMAAFAERLKALREGRKLTQARLAELIGVSLRAYNRWERGTFVPQLDTLIRIADVLQLSLDELTGRKDSSREPRIRNHELHTLVQQVDELPDEDQRALILVMDGLVKKAKVARVYGSTPAKRTRRVA